MICRYLDFKGRGPHVTADELREVVDANEVPYGCLRTGREWGPDDGVAVPERCTPDRPCFRR